MGMPAEAVPTIERWSRMAAVKAELKEPAGQEVIADAMQALIRTVWICGCRHEVRFSFRFPTTESWHPCREHAQALPPWRCLHRPPRIPPWWLS